MNEIIVSYYREHNDQNRPWLIADFAIIVNGGGVPIKLNGLKVCKSKTGRYFIAFPGSKYTNREGQEKEFRFIEAYSPDKEQYLRMQHEFTQVVFEAINRHKGAHQYRSERMQNQYRQEINELPF